MQDFQSISELAGKIFGGSGGGGGGGGAENRRLRGYSGGGGGPDPPAKCPRCESTNTKFCYYNNYNLSQPRHFCKSCRRYWTKGGVLRNVPVGGGCRKSSSSKRSTSSSSSSKKSSKARRRPPAASRSSSDSSSLTATTPPAAPAAVSASFHDPSLFEPQTSNPNPSPDFDPVGPEPPPLVPVQEMFPESGTFTSLMAAAASAGPAFLGFNFSDPPPPLRIPPQQQKAAPVADEIRIPELTPDLIDATMPVDLPRMGGGGGINGLDWPGAVDPSFFDLAGTVDPGVYFSPANWCDADPSLYLP